MSKKRFKKLSRDEKRADLLRRLNRLGSECKQYLVDLEHFNDLQRSRNERPKYCGKFCDTMSNCVRIAVSGEAPPGVVAGVIHCSHCGQQLHYCGGTVTSFFCGNCRQHVRVDSSIATPHRSAGDGAPEKPAPPENVKVRGFDTVARRGDR